MKKRYYALIFLIILTECLPLIIVFFNTSVRTNCIIVTCALLGWLMLIGVLISCYIQTNSRVSKKQKEKKERKIKMAKFKDYNKYKTCREASKTCPMGGFCTSCMYAYPGNGIIEGKPESYVDVCTMSKK